MTPDDNPAPVVEGQTDEKPTSRRTSRDFKNPEMPKTDGQSFSMEVKPLEHNWVQRGIKLSCEGANHPTHFSMLRQ